MKNIIGQSFGRYHILEQLGEGGMATVFKAYDTRLEREVAIKVIRTDAFPPNQLDRILKRFEREAKALAKLSHLHIIKVIDYGEHDGSPYLVMEYMPGGTLKQLMGKPMPWQEAVQILIPIAEALDHAHEQRIIHRDIKPSNILLTQKGQPMLTDFGIAKILESEETATLTGTGIGVGTPEYMAPEQWTGQSTAQSDLYSLGIVFYEMLTGRKPYTADTPAAILLKQANEALPRPGKFVTDLPQKVENILLKTLAKNPNDRYHDMVEFAGALEGLSGGKETGKRIPVPKNRGTPAHEQSAENKKPVFPRFLIWVIPGLAVLILGLIAVFNKPLPAQQIATQTPGTTPEFAPGSTMTGQDGATLVFVPAGEFTMGSDSSPDEQPVHQVTLGSYWIDRTEVTNAQYTNCVDAGKCLPPVNMEHFNDSNYAAHPVVHVNWDQAKAYCSWAGRRLPSEAEWEKAARGTDARAYPWGGILECSKANFFGCENDTAPVGSYEGGKSPYGAYDMAGNVWEWVKDWYSPDYYQNSPGANPAGPDSGQFRVLRGGAATSYFDQNARSAARYKNYPTVTYNSVGFRCALSTAP
jgi:serine/threonine-protein kinase